MSTLFEWIEYVVVVFEICLAVYFTIGFMTCRFRNNKTIIVSMIYALLAGLIIFYFGKVQVFSWINVVLSPLLVMGIQLIIYRDTLIQIGTVSAIYIAINLSCDFIIVSVAGLFLPENAILDDLSYTRLSAVILSKITLFNLVQLSKKYKLEKNKIANRYWAVLFVLLNIIIWISFFMLVIMRVYEMTSISNVFMVVFYLSMLAFVVAGYAIFFLFLKKQKQLEEYEIISIKNKMLEKALENNEQALERWKKGQHDFKHNLLCIQDMLCHGEYKESEQYIKELVTITSEHLYYVKTGNRIADILINHYLSLAKSYQIDFIVNAVIPKQFNISDMDLCAILGNVLENAFEAVHKCNIKEVWFHARAIKGMMIFKIINTSNEVILEEGMISTSKADKEHHGIGMKSIVNTTKKNNGFVDFSYTDGKFQLSLIFQLPRE